MKLVKIGSFSLFLLIICCITNTIGQDSLSLDTTNMITLVVSDTLKTEVKTDSSSTDLVSESLQPPPISELISFSKIFWSIVFMIIGYFVIGILIRLLEVFAEKSAKYRITVKSFIPVVKIMGWILIIFIVIAGIFQPPAATILAFSASIGVAVGFASQDILKNIFGGVMILFDRPFKVGDKIEVGSFYGEVVEIGLRSTRIVTPDDSLVSIPNSEIMNESVSNSNAGEANCQVVAEFYLPIGVDTARARAIAIQAAQVSKYVFLNKPIAVLFFNELKENRPFIKMRLKAYVMDIRDEFRFKSDMTELVVKEFCKEGLIALD